QLAPAAALERDDVDTRLPRAQRRADRRALAVAAEIDVEPGALDREVDLEVDDARATRGLRVAAQPRTEALLHRERLAAGQLDAPVGHEVQLVAQPVDEAALGVL